VNTLQENSPGAIGEDLPSIAQLPLSANAIMEKQILQLAKVNKIDKKLDQLEMLRIAMILICMFVIGIGSLFVTGYFDVTVFAVVFT